MRPLLFSHETDTVIPEKLQVGEIIRLCWIYFDNHESEHSCATTAAASSIAAVSYMTCKRFKLLVLDHAVREAPSRETLCCLSTKQKQKRESIQDDDRWWEELVAVQDSETCRRVGTSGGC